MEKKEKPYMGIEVSNFCGQPVNKRVSYIVSLPLSRLPAFSRVNPAKRQDYAYRYKYS
jgi:hypothetical protein